MNPFLRDLGLQDALFLNVSRTKVPKIGSITLLRKSVKCHNTLQKKGLNNINKSLACLKGTQASWLHKQKKLWNHSCTE